MTPRTNTNPDTIIKALRLVLSRHILTFVKLKHDLTQVIQFRNRLPLNLRLHPTLKHAVEKGIDMTFFREIKERLRLITRLHLLEVLHDLAEERERGEKTDLELLRGRDAVFLRSDVVEKDFAEFVELTEFVQARVKLGFGLPAGDTRVEVEVATLLRRDLGSCAGGFIRDVVAGFLIARAASTAKVREALREVTGAFFTTLRSSDAGAVEVFGIGC